MEKAQEFEKFLNDSLRPDYLKAVQFREDILDECREYEYLLLAIQKIQVLNFTSYTPHAVFRNQLSPA